MTAELRAPVRRKMKPPDPDASWRFILVSVLCFTAAGFWLMNSDVAHQWLAASSIPVETGNIESVDAHEDVAPDRSEPAVALAAPATEEHWEDFAPRSKDACLQDGSGTFDAEFLACRRGGRRLIRIQDGRRTIVEEQINDYSKVTPEDAAAAQARLKRWQQSSEAPARQGAPAQRGNSAIAAAEAACNVHRTGTVEYRQCRASMWRRFRDTCIRLRGELPFVKAELRDAHRRSTEMYCDAERTYRIID